MGIQFFEEYFMVEYSKTSAYTLDFYNLSLKGIFHLQQKQVNIQIITWNFPNQTSNILGFDVSHIDKIIKLSVEDQLATLATLERFFVVF